MSRRNPYPVLAVAIVLPAVLLALLWRAADQRSTRPSAPPSTVASAPLGTAGAAPVGHLGAPLLSARRAPGVLSATLNADDFAADLAPVVAKLPKSACLSVSVNGEQVVAHRADTALRPASNVKLVVGAVAAQVLGPTFTYRTEVRGALSGGTVDGDLYLVGGGDPVLSEPWWKESTITLLPPTVITDITALADAVVAAGVQRVTGGVVGDGSRYDDERYAPTVPNAVRAQLEALPVSALEVNDTRVSDKRAADNPNLGGAQVFARLLKERGVEIADDSSTGAAPDGAAAIAGIDSAVFPEILHEMLSTSDNLSAEMILKELAVAKGRPGTREDGIAVVGETLAGWGIDTAGMTLVDGSGISDENRLTCTVLVDVLQRGRYDDPVGAGLAVAGQEGTTLAGAFEDTDVAGKLRAKTGTLNNADGIANKPGAKTLAGYLPLAGGGQIEFALLLNAEDITTKTVYRPIWNAFAKVIAAYPSGPSVADLGPATSGTEATPDTGTNSTADTGG